MRKNFLLLISFIVLFLSIFYLRVETENEKILRGKIVGNNLYVYDLMKKDRILKGYYLDGNIIYYLLSYNDNYELYERSIYKETEQVIKQFISSDNCSLVNDYINCSNDKKIVLYNYDYQKIYETTLDTTNYPKIIKYKDIFLKYLDNTLYITQQNKDVVFRVLPQELGEIFVEDYYVLNNNTYLLLFNLDGNTYYIYDINKEEYKKIISKNSYKYDKGFYFYDKDSYKIVDLIDNREESYNNLLGIEYCFTSFLNNKELYYFNILDDEINMLNLENNVLKKIKLDITKNNNISNLVVKDNLLYIEIQDNEGNIYVLNLDGLDYEVVNILEKIEKEEEALNSLKEEIKEDDNITIHIKDDIIEFPDFTALKETDNLKINQSIMKIKQILNKYNKDFFTSFYYGNYEGLHLYLTSTLAPIDLDTQISRPAAYSLVYNNKYMIVIDINQPNIEELLCHEMIHNVEFLLNRKNIVPFKDWQSYNPRDFSYNDSYTKPYIYDYTLEDEQENIYFIDKYSHTFETEDRARIFENICAYKENSIVKNYPNIYNKALYLQEELYNYYPSLKESSLFDSLE